MWHCLSQAQPFVHHLDARSLNRVLMRSVYCDRARTPSSPSVALQDCWTYNFSVPLSPLQLQSVKPRVVSSCKYIAQESAANSQGISVWTSGTRFLGSSLSLVPQSLFASAAPNSHMCLPILAGPPCATWTAALRACVGRLSPGRKWGSHKDYLVIFPSFSLVLFSTPRKNRCLCFVQFCSRFLQDDCSRISHSIMANCHEALRKDFSAFLPKVFENTYFLISMPY